MSPRKTAIATVVTIAVAATGLAPTGVARAADSSEVQELKREISQMRAEVQALQVVLAEATELERQRSVNLSRAVKESATPPAPAPAGNSEPASAPPEPARAAAAPSASPSEKTSSTSRHRRHHRSPRSRSKLR